MAKRDEQILAARQQLRRVTGRVARGAETRERHVTHAHRLEEGDDLRQMRRIFARDHRAADDRNARATERGEGLGANVLLSGWDVEVLRGFLGDVDALRRSPRDDGVSPSQIVVDDLLRRGYGS